MSSRPRPGRDPEVGPALAERRAVWRGARNLLFVASGRRNVVLSASAGLIATALLTAIFLHGDYPIWRAIAPMAMVAFMVGAQFAAVYAVERHNECVDHMVVRMHVLAQIHMVSMVAVTGGLHSPLLPSLGSAAALPIIFFGPHRTSRKLTASLVVLFAAMALMPRAWLGPTLPHDHYVAAALVAFLWMTFVVTIFVGRIHEATVQASDAVDRLNEEQVAASTEQLCRLQSVGSKVAHELKNPLASVKGLVQLMARSAESAKNRERLEVMQAEIARMETILSEYLSFSRPLDDLRPHAIDVADVVVDAVAAIAVRVEQGKLTLSIDARPAPIEADPRRLKEALLNVLANAVEATPAGGSLAVATRAGDGGGAVIEVRDTGRGIKPDDLERLGTSFFTTRDGGTGLGVVLAQNAVAQHGGVLHYASAPGKGTVVTIRLPRTPAPAAAAAVLTTSATRPLDPAA